jgi:hypothetical protein
MALVCELLLPDFQTAGEKEGGLQVCQTLREAAHALRSPARIGGMAAAQKENLRAIRSGLDPVKLRRRIEQKLRRIFALNQKRAPGIASVLTHG